MTKEEKDLVAKLGEAWNDFIRMDILHPDDRGEFKTHIHALQNIVSSRQAVRENDDLFYTHK